MARALHKLLRGLADSHVGSAISSAWPYRTVSPHASQKWGQILALYITQTYDTLRNSADPSAAKGTGRIPFLNTATIRLA